MADFLSIIDQIQKEHKEIARLVVSYHKALLDQGMDEQKALMMAAAYQKQLINIIEDGEEGEGKKE